MWFIIFKKAVSVKYVSLTGPLQTFSLKLKDIINTQEQGIKIKDEDINNLKQEISEIKTLLKELLKKND